MTKFTLKHIETDAWITIMAKNQNSCNNVLKKITKKPEDWKTQ